MKFSIISIVASAAFVSQALATPAPQGGNTVYHCDISKGLKCPIGYRCCVPRVIGIEFGTCVYGTTGPCIP